MAAPLHRPAIPSGMVFSRIRRMPGKAPASQILGYRFSRHLPAGSWSESVPTLVGFYLFPFIVVDLVIIAQIFEYFAVFSISAVGEKQWWNS